jgi:hypothetical protein
MTVKSISIIHGYHPGFCARIAERIKRGGSLSIYGGASITGRYKIINNITVTYREFWGSQHSPCLAGASVVDPVNYKLICAVKNLSFYLGDSSEHTIVTSFPSHIDTLNAIDDPIRNTNVNLTKEVYALCLPAVVYQELRSRDENDAHLALQFARKSLILSCALAYKRGWEVRLIDTARPQDGTGREEPYKFACLNDYNLYINQYCGFDELEKFKGIFQAPFPVAINRIENSGYSLDEMDFLATVLSNYSL